MDGRIERIQDHVIVPAGPRRERREERAAHAFPKPDGSPPAAEPETPDLQRGEDLPVGGALPEETGRRLDVIG